MMAAPWTDTLRQTPRQALIGVVRFYRFFLSPWLGSACRFEPTCSVYALGALAQHGARRGGWLTVKRLMRCHPYCAGGHDPVPSVTPRGPVRAMLRAAGGPTDTFLGTPLNGGACSAAAAGISPDSHESVSVPNPGLSRKISR